MRIQIWLIATLCSLSVTLVPAASEAADIHVSIEGTEISCPTSCSSEFILSQSDGTPKSYSGFTIEGRVDGSGTRLVAKVVMAESGGADLLQLQDAVISSTEALLTRAIAFWRVFSESDNDPSAPPTAHFTREAQGSLSRGTAAAENDWVKVSGYVLGDEIDVAQTKYVPCPTLNPCGLFSLSKYEDWFTLSGARGLTGWFKFNLKDSGDRLNLPKFKVEGTPASVADQSLRGMMEDDPKGHGYKSMDECLKRAHGKRCSFPR